MSWYKIVIKKGVDRCLDQSHYLTHVEETKASDNALDLTITTRSKIPANGYQHMTSIMHLLTPKSKDKPILSKHQSGQPGIIYDLATNDR